MERFLLSRHGFRQTSQFLLLTMSRSSKYNALCGSRQENDLQFSTHYRTKQNLYKNGFLECKQQAQVQGNTPTYVRPNIYQEPDTNMVIFCLFTVEMKFIQICNLQTFLWAAGLKRAHWVWMEWDR